MQADGSLAFRPAAKPTLHLTEDQAAKLRATGAQEKGPTRAEKPRKPVSRLTQTQVAE